MLTSGLWDGRFGVWSIHLREQTPQLGQGDASSSPGPGVDGSDLNAHSNQSFDLIWGKKFGGTSLGLRLNRSFYSLEGSLIGGMRMRALHAELAVLARGHDVVLIRGERGAGKELVARELHVLSGAEGEFVAVRCAALREAQLAELLDLEAPDSLLAEAHGGTLFLSDIDALSLDVQRRLHRLLDLVRLRHKDLPYSSLWATSRFPPAAKIVIGQGQQH